MTQDLSKMTRNHSKTTRSLSKMTRNFSKMPQNHSKMTRNLSNMTMSFENDAFSFENDAKSSKYNESLRRPFFPFSVPRTQQVSLHCFDGYMHDWIIWLRHTLSYHDSGPVVAASSPIKIIASKQIQSGVTDMRPAERGFFFVSKSVFFKRV